MLGLGIQGLGLGLGSKLQGIGFGFFPSNRCIRFEPFSHFHVTTTD